MKTQAIALEKYQHVPTSCKGNKNNWLRLPFDRCTQIFTIPFNDISPYKTMSKKSVFWFHAFYLVNWAFELYCDDDENDAKIKSCATKLEVPPVRPRQSFPLPNIRCQRPLATIAILKTPIRMQL